MEAIKLANETGAYLIVHSHDEAVRLAPLCNRFPVTFDEFLDNRMRGSHVRNIVIDQADMLIQRIASGLTIEGITLDKPEQL